MLSVEINAEHSWHFATTKLLLELTSKWTNQNFNITSILTAFYILAQHNLDWRHRVSFLFSQRTFSSLVPPKMGKKKKMFFKSGRTFLLITMEIEVLFHCREARRFRVRVIAYDVGNGDSFFCWKARVGTWFWVSYKSH